MKGLSNDEDNQDRMFPEAYWAAITHSAAPVMIWDGMRAGQTSLGQPVCDLQPTFPCCFRLRDSPPQSANEVVASCHNYNDNESEKQRYCFYYYYYY
ncbi:hypothetical protein E2C01_019401 [Portunus trituberculatus]|uniref:Uncharacterized protein n=1 Tax=Portunus trituberculatus TaxID=210409 RepID=A0A5B7DY60_PORTR|nr:hypothetical protein [Portunus trituberculatus]